MAWITRLTTAGAWTFYGALVGVAGTIFVGAYGFLNKDRELDIEMIKISLSILAGENDTFMDTSSSEEAAPGRAFALRALEKYSGVNIPQAEFDIWEKRGKLPKSLRLSTWTDMALSEADEIRDGGYIIRQKRNGDVEYVRPPAGKLNPELSSFLDDKAKPREK